MAMNSDTRIFTLWEAGMVPDAQDTEDDADIPAVTVYAPEKGANTGAAVIVCPGGGYGVHAPHEAEPVARWLNTLGITGVVLRYRLGPRYHHPVMLHDAARAIRTVREGAKNWNIDPQRIGILGFSAGGHLASSISVHFDGGDPASPDPVERQSSRPDLAVLIYPVITMEGQYAHDGSRRNLLGDSPTAELMRFLSSEEQVKPDTPPTFLVHSSDDPGVPVQHSLLYALALQDAGVPFAMQVYERGGHGYGMGGDDSILSGWPRQCALWMKQRGFV